MNTTAASAEFTDSIRPEKPDLKYGDFFPSSERDALKSANARLHENIDMLQETLSLFAKECAQIQRLAAKPSGWVMCSERMPTQNDATKEGEVLWKWSDGAETGTWARFTYDNSPVAWMSIPPLPEPKSEAKDDPYDFKLAITTAPPPPPIWKPTIGDAVQWKNHPELSGEVVATAQMPWGRVQVQWPELNPAIWELVSNLEPKAP